MMRRLTVLAVAAALFVPAALAADRPFPDVVPLPPGFQPEGIAIGGGTTFYVGSIPTGAVYRGDLRTGTGAVVVPGGPGAAAIGLGIDGRNRLFVAGGGTGKAFVYDAATGVPLASYQLVTDSDPTFVNDVAVTKGGAWFTDSNRLVLYHVPVAPNGDLATTAETLPLTGDLQLGTGINLNGIEATPDGKRLVAVQSNSGLLFTIDPVTGETHEIDLGGTTLVNGDGLLLLGRTLYVVQNRFNQIAVVRLDADFEHGTVQMILTDPDLDIPTTIDRLGSHLYVVNARFGIPPTPTTLYRVVRVG
jgi:sugar lactone lactonase YvrE